MKLIFISNEKDFEVLKKEIPEKIFDSYLYGSLIGETLASYFDFELNREELIFLRKKISIFKIDLIQIEELIPRNQKSLFCFDMDSTLIKEEVIDELAREKKVFDEVAKVTKEAMEGGLDFNEALKKRVSLLDGLDESVFEKVYTRLNPHDGVPEAIDVLKKRKAEIAIFSGGFIPILKKFSEEYGISIYHANVLDFQNGKTTGKILGEIINKKKKKELLINYKNQFQLDKKYTIAVGDGSNDSEMILEAGIGIGFHAKEGLKKEILNWIDFHPMTSLLFLFDRND